MQNTVLIEQTAKNIKLTETIPLTVRFSRIAVGLGGMYLSIALGVAMLILAGIALIGFMRSASGAGGGTDNRRFKSEKLMKNSQW